MKSNHRLRQWLLFAAFAATLLAVVWVGDEEAEPVLAAKSPGKRQSGDSGAAVTATAGGKPELLRDFERLGKREVSLEFGDMFPHRSWEPPRGN